MENATLLIAQNAARSCELREIADKVKGNAAVDQRSRLLLALRGGSISTLEARRYLDVLHPAGRVMELRGCRWHIDTLWVNELTEAGKLHKVARYVLREAPDEH